MMNISNIRLKSPVFPIFFLLITVSSLHSKTFLVPTKYQSLQSAIDASKAGDTILVDEGIYYENIRINKNIMVASRFISDGNRSHIERTVIDGSRFKDSLRASTVTILGGTDTTCIVLGFTLQGGRGTYDFVPGDLFSEHWIGGGGVCIINTGARIAHNIIRENVLNSKDSGVYVYGAGIATVDASNKKPLPPFLIIEQNTIIGNTCSGHLSEASGIWVGQPAVVRNNVVIGNRAFSRSRSYGGGIYVGLTDEYDIVVDGNYINKNTASIGGGVLITSAFVRRGRAIFMNNIISGNEAFEVGGAANVAEEAYAIFVNNTITRNKGMGSGGGINVTYGAHATLVNNIIWNNEVDQVSIWGNVQAYNNISDGTLSGKNNINGDPEFLPNDSLYQLSPNSPGNGTGETSLAVLGKIFPMPQRDFHGSIRSLYSDSAPDIGAIESPWEQSAATDRILDDQMNLIGSNLKLTFFFRQITHVVRKKENREIIRAGGMLTTLIVNDSAVSTFEEEQSHPAFTLPPGRNLLEVEILARSIDSTKGLNVYYHLQGSDPQVRILRRKSSYVYYNYSDLKPGSYTLVLQPQDEYGIIGYTNRVSIDISVMPFWYQRSWAYVLFTFGIIGIMYNIYRTRVKRVLLEQKLITEHLQSEKLSEMNSMKSRFLANVSHELRTPLSLILGPVASLITKKPEREHLEQLGIIQRNAQRLLRLIELLLQFSRLESGTVKLQVSQEDVVSILRRISGYFSSPAAKKQIEMKFKTEHDSITGMIDAEKIEHILQNCISNAIKFTPSGGSIEVMVRKENNVLVFSVKDNGEGIAPEHASHVFERFYRIDPTHKMEGTGIGLSLSKELVEIHHGSMILESELGKGTIVTVRIPLTGYSESEIVRRTSKDITVHEPVHDSSSLHAMESLVDAEDRPIILIAEDNEDARLFIRSELSPQYIILEAVDGEDAFNKTKFQIPDLVISDVMMPKMDGRELCKALKQDERTSHIPVILLTALAEKEDRIKGLTTGADDYLVKPFDSQELLTRVHNLLENRKKLREAYGKTVPLSLGEISVTSLDDTFLIKAIAIVNTHIAEPEFGVENFAHEMFLSRTQLNRKLKAITNLAPSDFIRHLRLHRAKELLEKNAGTVAEIADRVGFSNHSYFARCFQEQFGLLPNEVRHPQKY